MSANLELHRPIAWPGAAAQAVAFGRALLPHSLSVGVHLPGAFVFGGFDHALLDGRFRPLRRAWARGEEPMVPLDETPRWAPCDGLDDTTPPRWAPIANL